MTFGERIYTLRKSAGLSQEELAERLDVSRQAISKWERGAGYPETEKLINMSRLFGVTVDYLLGGDGDYGGDEERGEDPREPESAYLSEEDTRRFIAFCKRRSAAKGAGLAAITAGLGFGTANGRLAEILFVLLVIAGALLLVSVFKWDNPYRKLTAHPALLSSGLRAELEAEYAAVRPRWQGLSLAGLAMILLGFFLFPTLAPEQAHELDDFFTAAGLVLAGAGFFPCVYFSGALKAYKLLLAMNDEYYAKRK